MSDLTPMPLPADTLDGPAALSHAADTLEAEGSPHGLIARSRVVAWLREQATQTPTT